MNMKWIISVIAVLLTLSSVSNAWASRDPLGGGDWITRDSVAVTDVPALNLNLYRYVGNDPVDLTDPLGLFSCKEICSEIDTNKNALKILEKMIVNGKSLAENGGKQRGSAEAGADTPLGTEFENNLGNTATGLATHGIFALGYAGIVIINTSGVYHAPYDYNSAWAGAELVRHQDYINQLNAMAKKQGCDCSKCK